MLSPEYLAGFVDGEGYLGVARIRRRHRSPEYCLRMSVYNSDLKVLNDIREVYGGTLSSPGQRERAWKPGYALIWTNAAAAKMISEIGPFLVVKANQAKALLAFDKRLQVVKRSRDRDGRLLPYSSRELRARETFYKRLKWLNRRGVRRWNRQNATSRAGAWRLSAKYVAGFIDAEGALMITRSFPADCRSPQHHGRVSVSNTKRNVLDAIHGRYGGILTYQPARQAGWSHGYQLVWTNGMIIALLRAVGRHLRIKRKQAAVLIEFIEQKRAAKQRRDGSRSAPLPARVIAPREGYRRRIRELNARGSRH